MSDSRTIPADQDDRRLERVLKALFPEVPHGLWMRAFRTKAIRLDGRVARPADRARAGQALDLLFAWNPGEEADSGPFREEPPLRAIPASPDGALPPPGRGAGGLPHPPEGFPPILYEDERFLVVDKPAGLPVQPDRAERDSLIRRIWARFPGLPGSGFRPAAAHRLDRNVTGAVWIALTGPALRLAAELIRERRIRKFYLALVAGSPPESGAIRIPLRKNPLANRVDPDPSGLPAETRYRVRDRGEGLARVELELVTGRPHQARAHCAAAGFPILGDRKYAPADVGRRAARPLLHAERLVFPEDPRLGGLSGRAVAAPIPAEMRLPLRARQDRREER